MQQVLKTVRTWAAARRTILATFVGTGGYVIYADSSRNQRMVQQFQKGNILPPCSENLYESQYMERPELQKQLAYILGPQFTNEYYLVKGEVGSGKSRSIVEMVRKMVAEAKTQKTGAPVYVLASQGKHFSDTLGRAVHFDFDEHINFKFFLKYMLQIDKFPARDNHNKLTRVLDAIECSAHAFTHQFGKPVVLVIDGVNTLTDHFPGALQKLQEKAKLWADTNICKVIFVNNEEKTEYILQKSSSCWSRAGTPVYVGSLSQSDSVHYLMNGYSNEAENPSSTLSEESALDIYSKVGGKVQYLTLVKRDHSIGIPFEETLAQLKDKEQEKILRSVKSPEMWKVIEIVKKTPEMTISLLELVKHAKPEAIDQLADLDVIRYERRHGQVVVTFESRLTRATLESLVNSQ